MAAAGDTADPAELERGRWLFAQDCVFQQGARTYEQLPPPGPPEVAFAGRSNVGKSSLINALVGRKQLARTSNTPGRTQEVNFFLLGGCLRIVDLPGYGYARASKGEIRRWNRLIEDYLRGRPGLRRVFLLVDGRRGIGDSDLAVMKLLDEAAVGYQVVLTKIDKVRPAARSALLADTAATLRRWAAAHPELHATSAQTGEGIPELRAAAAMLAAEGTAELQGPA